MNVYEEEALLPIGRRRHYIQIAIPEPQEVDTPNPEVARFQVIWF
jgi:hypothetical protein